MPVRVADGLEPLHVLRTTYGTVGIVVAAFVELALLAAF